jgi:prepilin-type N-terminal cleavage/methylation domain-containing protein
MTRRGFTLLELMIALVIGSTVVLLAYATLRGGMDTAARVTRVRDDEETVTILRAMLGDAIRHAITGEGTDGATGLRLDRGADGRVERLRLTTRGIEPPYGATGAWALVLHHDRASVLLDADPLTGTRGAALRLRATALRGFGVRFLAPAETRWRDRWDDTTRLPAAVEIAFLSTGQRQSGAPLVVRTSAMGNP